MIIREGIEVTSITLDGYEFPIPEGFSEFLLRAGYWWVGEEVETINREEILLKYDREVFVENGRLHMRITYKGNKKSWMKRWEDLMERKEWTILDNPPSKETALKMAALFMKTSVSRILAVRKAEQEKRG